MSVGFRDEQHTERPPLEHVVWRVAKDSRTAEALVRTLPHGRELRVFVVV